MIVSPSLPICRIPELCLELAQLIMKMSGQQTGKDSDEALLILTIASLIPYIGLGIYIVANYNPFSPDKTDISTNLIVTSAAFTNEFTGKHS